ncbi:MAG: discoidin domain-containing protein [archaeon]|nr:discoidin domain-containing protein [archaeon]MCP8305888.1 discoidin domain-containing protein [archaeon]
MQRGIPPFKYGWGISDNVIDNDTTSMWYPNPVNEANAWIYVDLGGEKIITGIKVYWGADVAYRPTNYDLDYSLNASDWAHLLNQASDPGSGWKEHIFSKIIARYVRLQVNTHGSSGTKVYEIMYQEGYEVIYKMSDEILSCSIEHGEGGLPCASLELENVGNKFSSLEFPAEIEIRLGDDDALLFLLFRGYIDSVRKKFPPSILEIESAQGYAKRLNFREAKSKSYSAQTRGAIIKDLVDLYFSGTFTYDHVSGGSTASYDFNDEPIGEIIKQLADDEGYVFYVDENKDIHFASVSSEETRANITIRKGEEIIQIEHGEIDEILNKIYVKGSGAVSATGEDSASQSAYWLRERTETDTSITDNTTAQKRADSLTALHKDPGNELSLSLPSLFLINLFDKVTITCDQVGLNAEESVVKAYAHALNSDSLTTDLELKKKSLSMAEILAEYEKKLEGVE